MPRNNGEQPTAELVDLKFRNGHIVRSTPPEKWRWESWAQRGRPDLDPHPFDIEMFNIVKEKSGE